MTTAPDGSRWTAIRLADKVAPATARGRGVDVDAERSGGGDRRGGIVDQMPAAGPQADVGAPPRRAQTERRPGEFVERDAVDGDVGVGATSPNVTRRRCVSAAHRPNPLVVGVEDRQAMCRQRLDELRLGPGHAVDPAEPGGVGGGDGRDDADRRRGDRAEPGDLPEAAHSHLQHEHVDVRRRRRGPSPAGPARCCSCAGWLRRCARHRSRPRRGPWSSSCRRFR